LHSIVLVNPSCVFDRGDIYSFNDDDDDDRRKDSWMTRRGIDEKSVASVEAG